MNGRTHVVYGIGLVFLVYVLIMYICWIKDTMNISPSFLAFFVGGTFGALFPDFDLFFGIGKHRNTLTHSSIFPVLVTFSYGFNDDVFARTLLMFICFGMATHLTFDLFISDVPEEYKSSIVKRWAYRIGAFLSGKVGGKFKGNGNEWANKHKREYLIVHAISCMICGILLAFAIYNEWVL